MLDWAACLKLLPLDMMSPLVQVAELHADSATPSRRGEECRADAPLSHAQQGGATPEVHLLV